MIQSVALVWYRGQDELKHLHVILATEEEARAFVKTRRDESRWTVELWRVFANSWDALSAEDF